MLIMRQQIDSVNPDILKWARERSGLSPDEAAKNVSKVPGIVEDWEKGLKAPTYIQLQKLSEKYHRPIAIFFFPEPPEEPDLIRNISQRSFSEKVSPSIHILCRHAYLRQIALSELHDNSDIRDDRIFIDINANLNDNILDLVEETRDYLGVDIETQLSWDNMRVALNNWRNIIQEKGIYVFKEAFKDHNVDGFCLSHRDFPVIFLNNSRFESRQIFTLFHELAHILLYEDGITSDINSGTDNVELYCNCFASDFLVPSDHFKKFYKSNYTTNDNSFKFIYELAEKYKVSKHVILIKSLKENLISKTNYNYILKTWSGENKDRGLEIRKSTGGYYYHNEIVYLGYKFLDFMFSKYYQGRCSIEDLAEYFNVKVKFIPTLENAFIERITG